MSLSCIRIKEKENQGRSNNEPEEVSLSTLGGAAVVVMKTRPAS